MEQPPPPPLRLMGAPGSPYTRKVMAAMRYRRIPYQLILRAMDEDVDLPRAKGPLLLPNLIYPDDRAVADSTFILRDLEDTQGDARRKLRPSDQALAFIGDIIEDYADEWTTKHMFHVRWAYGEDVAKASKVLSLWSTRRRGTTGETRDQIGKLFAQRQVERLSVVGSNDATRPVIIESYTRLLQLLNDHFYNSASLFMLGDRPSACDFALYGQLTQLVTIDPTGIKLADIHAPYVTGWTTLVDDLSGIEVSEEDWFTVDEKLPITVYNLLCEIGRLYVPFMLANAQAIANGEKEVRCTLEGKLWIQPSFKYQAKCLSWLREGFAELSAKDQSRVRSLIAGTGCEPLLSENSKL